MKKLITLMIVLFLPLCSANAESIASRVQAPPSVKGEYQSATGLAKVFVDAVVALPDVEVIPIYEVKHRLFTTDELARAADEMIGESQWGKLDSYAQGDVFADDPAPAYKVPDDILNAGNWGDYYECQLRSLTEAKRRMGVQFFDVPIRDGYYYLLSLRYEYNAGYNSSHQVGTPEEARIQADAIVMKLWPEMAFHSIDKDLNVHDRTGYAGGPADYGYRVYYTRVIDGVPVTAVYEQAHDEKTFGIGLPYEKLYVDVGAEGVFQAVYDYPMEIVGMLAPDAELLPFADIMKAFTQISPQTIAMGEYATNNALYIDRIELVH